MNRLVLVSTLALMTAACADTSGTPIGDDTTSTGDVNALGGAVCGWVGWRVS